MRVKPDSLASSSSLHLSYSGGAKPLFAMSVALLEGGQALNQQILRQLDVPSIARLSGPAKKCRKADVLQACSTVVEGMIRCKDSSSCLCFPQCLAA